MPWPTQSSGWRASLCAAAGALGCCTLAWGADLVPEEVIAAHTHWRAEVGVPPLRYSATLALSAQQWADVLQTRDQCQLRHSQSPFGENIFGTYATGNRTARASATHVVNAWGSEKKDYDATHNRCKPGTVCGHYTQVVWRTSAQVGCGVARCESGNTTAQVWVCQYDPPGNYRGQRPY